MNDIKKVLKLFSQMWNNPTHYLKQNEWPSSWFSCVLNNEILQWIILLNYSSIEKDIFFFLAGRNRVWLNMNTAMTTATLDPFSWQSIRINQFKFLPHLGLPFIVHPTNNRFHVFDPSQDIILMSNSFETNRRVHSSL